MVIQIEEIMAKEIEVKYLPSEIFDESLMEPIDSFRIIQGYVSYGTLLTRVRIQGDLAFLTLKGETVHITRDEWEYPIPVEDAEQMLSLVDKKIEKTRFLVEVGDDTWEIDVFDGDNKGLIVAEIELPDADTPYYIPKWLNPNAILDPKYNNVSLLENPYCNW